MVQTDYPGTGQEHHILEVQEDGLVVCLDDGSVWDVSVGDDTISFLWYPTMRIVVEKNDSPTHPFSLKNLDTAGPDVVRASVK